LFMAFASATAERFGRMIFDCNAPPGEEFPKTEWESRNPEKLKMRLAKWEKE
jgi:hypothetical protein